MRSGLGQIGQVRIGTSLEFLPGSIPFIAEITEFPKSEFWWITVPKQISLKGHSRKTLFSVKITRKPKRSSQNFALTSDEQA